MQPRPVSKLFLRPAAFLAQSPQSFAKFLPDIHAPKATLMLPIDLQPMSLIFELTVPAHHGSTRVMEEANTPPEGRKLRPAAVRYIKLGQKGALAEECIKQGLLVLQHTEVPHELAAAGAWGEIRTLVGSRSRDAGTVTRWVNEVQTFYEPCPETLWVTFHAGHLWWGFAEAEVLAAPDSLHPGGRYRNMRNGWRKTDLAGNALPTDRLSTTISRTAAYRGTICALPAADQLVRLINCEESPVVAETLRLRAAFEASLVGIIRSLHQNDFELLTDLVFHRLGWQRIGALGGQQADTDLVLVQPATGQRALVQVKSSASQTVVEDYGRRFAAEPEALPFLVCHSPSGKLTPPAARTDMIIWDGEALARKASEAGLVDWLLEHAA